MTKNGSLFPIILAGFTSILITACQYNSVSAPSATDLDPTFSNTSQILMTSCGGSNCHIGQETSGVQLDSYDNMINSLGKVYGESIVQPGNPEGSPVINKIGPDPRLGSRMPLGRPPLQQEQIELIRAWIEKGAAYD